MASRPDQLPYESRVGEVVLTYRRAQREIARQIRVALASGALLDAAQRQAQLAAVVMTLDRLGMQTDAHARQLVADAYTQSAQKVVQQIAALQIDAPEIPGAFAGVSQPAVQALQDSMLGRLSDARRSVGRAVDDIYARAGRRVAMRAVLGVDGSPRAARRALMRDLMRDPQVRRMVQQGGYGFVDRAGRRWALSDYADMVVRTTTREAVVQGAIARMASHGIDLARVSRHASSCVVCRPWEDRLVSLDGSTKDYEGEAVADLGALPNGGPPFHPRCRHSLQPVAVRIERIRRDLAVAA